MKLIILVLVLAALTASKCSDDTPLNDINSLNKKNLIGEWTISEFKIIGEFDGDVSKFENLRIFSVPAWVQSKGKYFKFLESGVCETDITEPAYPKMNFNFQIENDSTVQFTHAEHEQLTFETSAKVRNNEMIWIIDSFARVNFRKE